MAGLNHSRRAEFAEQKADELADMRLVIGEENFTGEVHGAGKVSDKLSMLLPVGQDSASLPRPAPFSPTAVQTERQRSSSTGRT